MEIRTRLALRVYCSWQPAVQTPFSLAVKKFVPQRCFCAIIDFGLEISVPEFRSLNFQM